MKTSPRSTKGYTLVEILIVLVIFVLLGMMGYPALKKIRADSQDKNVLINLRSIYDAADQYYRDNGASSVASATIVGTNSSQYLKTFKTVAGETYTATLVSGSPITASGVAGTRTVTFP